MASFSFLHAADIHLDSPLTGLSRYDGVPAEDVRRAPRAAFDRLIATAIDRKVDFVVLAGDIYDGDWKDMGTGLYFSAAMGRLGQAGIDVYLLAGNHDAASVITRALPRLANVHPFSTRRAETHVIDRLGVALHGRSFADRAVQENLAITYPQALPGMFNIGLLHTSLGGDAQDGTYAPCTVQDLAARRYDYWALGHVHDHKVLSLDPYIVFPGNIQGRNIRETGPKGALLVQVQDGEMLAPERVVLDVVRWARVDVAADGLADVELLHARLRTALAQARDTLADGRPLIVRVAIEGETPLHGALQDVAGRLRDDVRGIANEVGGDLWVEKVGVRTAPPKGETHAAPAPETDEITDLLAGQDAHVSHLLQEEFARFLAPLSDTDPDGIVARARLGDWSVVMQTAGAALRARLAGAR